MTALILGNAIMTMNLKEPSVMMVVTEEAVFNPNLCLCSSCPLHLGPTHRDSGNFGYASMTHWPDTHAERTEVEQRYEE